MSDDRNLAKLLTWEEQAELLGEENQRLLAESLKNDEKIDRLEAELAEAVDAARALDRVRDVMGDYLSDEWVPMSRLLAALDGKTDRG